MYLLFCTDFYIFGNFVFFVFLVVQYRRSVISKIKRLDTNTRDFGYNNNNSNSNYEDDHDNEYGYIDKYHEKKKKNGGDQLITRMA